MLKRAGTVDTVQSAGRSTQVLCFLALVRDGMVVADIAAHLQTQSVRSEFLLIIIHLYAPCENLQLLLSLLYGKLRRSKVTIEHDLRRAVLKDTGLIILQAEQSICQHCDPVFFPLYYIVRMCARSG